LQRFGGAIDQPSAHELLQRRGGGGSSTLDAKRRKVRRQIRSDELVDALCVAQSAQLVCAQIAQRRPFGQMRADGFGGRRREQCLSSVTRGTDPLRSHERE
jgi:hypothetical protein